MTLPVFSVRPAVPHDLARLDLLFAASYPALLKADYLPSVMVTAVPLISRAQPALLQSGTYFVAEEMDGSLVGAGGWTRRPPGGGLPVEGVGHIRHVVTDHRRTRQGIGRAIIERVVETARAAGIRQLDCLSTRTALPFYRACDFAALRAVEVQLTPVVTFPAIAMRRLI